MTRKTALITGSGKGIGRGVALEMAKNGYNVVINYANSPEAARETLKEAEALGVETLLHKADVSVKENCKSLVDETIGRFGRIDVLVNNVGVGGRTVKIWDFPEEEFEQVMSVNLFSRFYMLKYATKHMIDNPGGGSVINVASVCEKEAFAGYVTSEGGSVALTKTAARDLAPYNINCNAIAPSGIGMDMILGMSPQETERMTNVVSMGRLGMPREIGAIAVFLASEDARHITGQTLVADGACRL